MDNSMEILLRTATLKDAEAIAALSGQLGYTASAEETADRLALLFGSEGNCIYVAENNGKVAGWAHGFYALRVESAPFAELAGLVVDESLRGTGIGRLLVNQVAQWAKTQNCTTLRVRTNVLRKETHKFYRHLGFTEIKEQKVFGKNI